MKYGEVTKVTEYVVANPQYIFSYPYHRDGEVMGLDGDGNLLVWDSSKAEVYNSGFTPDQFGVENLTDKERSRLPEQSERKFFRTIFEIEILSQEALPDTMTLEDLDFEMREGGCSGKITKTEGEEIGAFTCSKSLIKQGTDPELFRLDVLGRDIEV